MVVATWVVNEDELVVAAAAVEANEVDGTEDDDADVAAAADVCASLD